MIYYDCRTVLAVLLKKWYIVFCMMVFVGLISIPLERVSYQRAENNYNEIVSNAQGPQLYNINALYEVDEQLKSGMYIYLACLKDEELMQKICQIYDVTVQWDEEQELIEYVYNEKEHTLQVFISEIQEEDAECILKVITVYLMDYLDDHLCTGEFSEAGFWKSKCLDEGKIVAELVHEPGTMKTQGRIVVFAVVFGAILGCVIVMMCDYISKSKKMNETINKK